MADTNHRSAGLRGRLARVRGDFLGPLTAGLVSIPMEVNYGLIAVAPLGIEYAHIGVLAAIYTTIVASLATALAGTRGGLLGGTRPTLALTVAALIASLLHDPVTRRGGATDVGLVLAFVALTIAIAGVLQLLFSVLRLARAIKYLPYPVLAGFLNGVAVLLLIVSIRLILGLPVNGKFSEMAGHLTSIAPLTLLVALVTIAVAYKPPRFAAAIPGTILAIAVGAALFYSLRALFGADQLGGTFVEIPRQLPTFDLLSRCRDILTDPGLRAKVPGLLPAALAIAALASLESLLTASVVDSVTHSRHDSDRELAAQGVGNLAAAVCGGLASAAGTSRCQNNVRAGGSTRLSCLFYAAMAALLLLFGSSLLSGLPLAVTGGVLLVIAYRMIDDWSRRMPMALLSGSGLNADQRKTLAANFVVMLLAAATAVIADMVQAVFLGVIGSMFLFVISNSRAIIRRVADGVVRCSKKVRGPAHAEILRREGRRIVLLELEGALFFGTADRVAREVEGLAHTGDFIILDFRRVTDLDPTGARILAQISQSLKPRKKLLLLSALTEDDPRSRIVRSMDLQGALPDERWFDDADSALEWAENRLLEHLGIVEEKEGEFPIGETALGRGMNDAEIAVLGSYLIEQRFHRGEYVFHGGDAGDGMYVATAGAISIRVEKSDEGNARRLICLAPGVVFGELAVLGGKPRSTDAIADDNAVVLKLTLEAFNRLKHEHPVIFGKILFNLGQQLGDRLRAVTLDLRAAEL